MTGGSIIGRRPSSCVLAFILVSGTGPAFGAGFLLNDHGSRAAGEGNAVVATIDDASALFYNPAGLGRSGDIAGAYLGSSLVLPGQRYTDFTGVRTESATGASVVPHGYAFTSVGERLVLGLGLNAPFGSTITWGADSPGRSQLRELSLRTLFVSPGFSLDLGEGLRIGGTLDIVPSSVRLSRDILFGQDAATVALGGNALGFGGRVGVQYSTPAGFHAGLTLQTRTALDFSGDADFDAPTAAYRDALPPDGVISTKLVLPASLRVGVAYDFDHRFRASLDMNWIEWSTYDELRIVLPGGAGEDVSVRDYRNTVVGRLGFRYAHDGNAPWVARAGYAYDPRPGPPDTMDFTSADANRHVLSVGGGYPLTDRVHLDAALVHVLPAETRALGAPIPGTYGIDAWVGTVSAAFRLGNPAAEIDEGDDWIEPANQAVEDLAPAEPTEAGEAPVAEERHTPGHGWPGLEDEEASAGELGDGAPDADEASRRAENPPVEMQDSVREDGETEHQSEDE